MASGKIGSLIYNVIADTKQFKEGMVLVGRELTAAKKMFLETRNPIEKMGLQLDGIARLAKTGSGPVNMYTRSIASLAVSTKGGGVAARKYIADLRAQAQAISNTRLGIGGLSKEQLKLQATLRNLANETEREVNATRKAVAEKKRKELADRRATRAAAEQDAVMKRVNATLRRSIPTTDRLAKEEHELTAAFKRGKLGSIEYHRALMMLRREKERHLAVSGRETNKFGGQLIAIGKHIGVITLAYKALRVGSQAFHDQLEIERSTKQFEIFTGSAKTAIRLMDDIRNFSARTPITLQGGQQAVRTLMQYGVAASDVMKRLRQLGDISGGSLESLQRLSLAFGQISANTRLQGQELRQLIEAGFNPLQVMSEKTGVSMIDLRDRMADGKISIGDVEDALDAATSSGGRFNQMLKKIGSETNFGAIQRMGGEIRKALADEAKPVVDAAGESAGWVADYIGKPEELAKVGKEVQEMRVKLGRPAKRHLAGLPWWMDKGFDENWRNASYLGLDLAKSLREAQAELNSLNLIWETTEKMLEVKERPLLGVQTIIEGMLSDTIGPRKDLAIGISKLVRNTFTGAAEQIDVSGLARDAMKLLSQEDKDAAKKASEEEKAFQKRVADAEAFRQEIADSIKSPLTVLLEELDEVWQAVGDEPALANPAIRKMISDFEKSNLSKPKAIDAAFSGTSGSREEFQVISQIARSRQNTKTMHIEAQKLREKIVLGVKENADAMMGLPDAIVGIMAEPVE